VAVTGGPGFSFSFGNRVSSFEHHASSQEHQHHACHTDKSPGDFQPGEFLLEEYDRRRND
jgi:hypothetical protein